MIFMFLMLIEMTGIFTCVASRHSTLLQEFVRRSKYNIPWGGRAWFGSWYGRCHTEDMHGIIRQS